MPNKNYRNGAEKERKIVNKAREKGLIAFRSAGSHSPIDVITIDSEMQLIELIQSKGKNFSAREKEKLLEKYKNLNGVFMVEFKVV